MGLSDNAHQEAIADLQKAHDSGYWANAVAFLRQDLAPAATDIQKAIAASTESHSWVWPYHHGWGTAVRNRLREAGYGEKALGISNLDNVYVELVEEAMS